MATTGGKRNEKLIATFFKRLQEIHGGDEKAVERMLALWDEDGVVRLVGIHPYAGEFHGRNAIAVLYRNITRSSGMTIKLGARAQTSLGPRQFEVESIEASGDRVVATWKTTITTKDGRGFAVSGGDTFTFKGGKIATDSCIMSTKPEAVKGFKLAELSVSDIGTLALAAWAVV